MNDDKITNEDINNHLAQLKYIINNSKSQIVIDNARETEKVIKTTQIMLNANHN